MNIDTTLVAGPIAAPDPKQDLERPARKQVPAPVVLPPADEVNIWTGRRVGGERREGRRPPARSQYRCRPVVDSGHTRGSRARCGVFCRYFARGLCAEGAGCQYLHRAPTAADAAAHARDASRDIFGRERLPDRLDDRGGAGSYDRDSTTLYVSYGGAAPYSANQIRAMLSADFGAFGPLRAPPFVVPSKAIAFVRYCWRASAEFAKEAMHGQGLDGSKFDEVLVVKWASDDPNPQAVAARKRGAADALESAALAAWEALPADERAARIAAARLAAGRRLGEAAGEYPDTDAQYGGGGGGGGTAQHEQQQQQHLDWQQQQQQHYDWQQQQQVWQQQQQQQQQQHYHYQQQAPHNAAGSSGASASGGAAAGAWAWDAAANKWVWAGAASSSAAAQQQQQQRQRDKQGAESHAAAARGGDEAGGAKRARAGAGPRDEGGASEGSGGGASGGGGGEALGLLAAYGSASGDEGAGGG